jgi:serine/threonine-protein kinase
MCHVPILIGMKLPGATRKIKKAHCTVGEVISKYSNYVPGMVIQQHPAWGKTLATGTSIGLTVSLGPR